MRKTSNLTQERLKEIVNYNPETGVFIRLVSGHGVSVGDIAGTISNGYLTMRIDGITHRAHRLAFLYMAGYAPEQVDHINQIKTDNRWCNLRAADDIINNRNRPMPCTNKSGVVGVMWESRRDKWRAQIHRDGKCVNLGYYKAFDDAVHARKQAEKELGYSENHGSGAVASAAA